MSEHLEGAEAPPRGVRAAAIVRWLLVLGAAAAATFSVLHVTGVLGAEHEEGTWFCPMHPHVVQDHPGECPICHMTLVERGDERAAAAHHAAADAAPAGEGAYWCPMHPHVTSDDPDATCDLCGGMQLVPRPADAGDGAVVAIELSPERVQLMGLGTAVVERRTVRGDVRALATVGAAETGWAQVTPRVAGWLERVHVAETGARVKRGQTLATLHSPELVAAQEEYLVALDWTADTTLPALPPLGDAGAAPAPAPRADRRSTVADDARRRLEVLGLSSAQIAQLARTRAPLRTLTLRAPIAGHVASRGAVTGAYVQPGAVLFEIVDLSTVWAWIEVPERDLGRIAVGQPATLTVTAFPGERFPGEVGFLAPVVDPVTRTLRARIELPNPKGRLRPGLSGEAAIELPPVEMLAVPDVALIDTGNAQYVFVATAPGRFEPRRIAVGRRIGGFVEVLPGPSGAAALAPGEHVVTTGTFLLDAESRLQAKLGGGHH